nr:MAG TPA: hypothetical protein [Caudoviricetes sp.]
MIISPTCKNSRKGKGSRRKNSHYIRSARIV